MLPAVKPWGGGSLKGSRIIGEKGASTNQPHKRVSDAHSRHEPRLPRVSSATSFLGNFPPRQQGTPFSVVNGMSSMAGDDALLGDDDALEARRLGAAKVVARRAAVEGRQLERVLRSHVEALRDKLRQKDILLTQVSDVGLRRCW